MQLLHLKDEAVGRQDCGGEVMTRSRQHAVDRNRLVLVAATMSWLGETGFSFCSWHVVMMEMAWELLVNRSVAFEGGDT